MIIQIVLIALVGGIGIYFMLHRRSTRIQAGMKIALLLFTVGAVVSILLPDALTGIANRLGVGRGADLMLYGLIVAFVFTVLNTYLEFQERDALLARLARRIALLEAELQKARGRQGPEDAGAEGPPDTPQV